MTCKNNDKISRTNRILPRLSFLSDHSLLLLEYYLKEDLIFLEINFLDSIFLEIIFF